MAAKELKLREHRAFVYLNKVGNVAVFLNNYHYEDGDLASMDARYLHTACTSKQFISDEDIALIIFVSSKNDVLFLRLIQINGCESSREILTMEKVNSIIEAKAELATQVIILEESPEGVNVKCRITEPADHQDVVKVAYKFFTEDMLEVHDLGK